MSTSESLLLVTPQIRSRESYLLKLLSELLPVSVLSLHPPYRPIEQRGPHPIENRIVESWKWLWPAEQWVGDWTSMVPGSCSAALVRELRKLRARNQAPRWIWFSGASMAGVVEEAQGLGYRVIVDQDRMASSQILRDASSSFLQWIRLPEAWRDSYYERRRCERAHAVVASSPLHAARALKLAPHSRVRVLGPSVEIQSFQFLQDKPGTKLLFCGDLEDPAQQEGLLWFAEEVLPRLRAALKDQLPRILVAGPSAPAQFLRMLETYKIDYRTWDKNDLAAANQGMLSCLTEALICFLPHRKPRAGFQFLLQAMAAGRPVVSTTRSSAGLLFTPGQEIWIDDKPDAFTTALLKLIRTPELRKQTTLSALELIRKHHDWDLARSTLSELLKTS
ncbi:MAG: glycosyltransferase [Bdellovibrionales bacterium]|nr:glycosyltransferase [Bdellovibrionales bacterium]